jgi:hypothetical protein
MGKRSRRRAAGPLASSTTVDYVDDEGNVLTLRERISATSAWKVRHPGGSAAGTVDDRWRRRTEMLFERFVVRWEIAGLPMERQDELVGRYRIADQQTQQWVRRTLDEHVQTHQPGLLED